MKNPRFYNRHMNKQKTVKSWKIISLFLSIHVTLLFVCFEELFKEKYHCFCSANVTASVKVPKLAPDIFEFGHTRVHRQDVVYKVCVVCAIWAQ